ncbi:MAG: hypothetical protein PHY80_04380 [Rickettsiales bacterium]|nr:hypothetical protein [Rickettsiales bacterium]
MKNNNNIKENNMQNEKLTPLLISIENKSNTNGNNTNTNKTQTETDDKIQTEEDLSKYNDILKNYPKTKTYITQIYLIYPISKKAIEKAINARITIEHHFKDIYQENIIYGINQCFRFNKSRPSPAQVIAMITGDTVAELKQKEMEKHKSEKTEIEKYKEAKEKYQTLRDEALKQYFGEDTDKKNINNQNSNQNRNSNQNTNSTTNPIRQKFKTESQPYSHPNMYPTPIEILDEIMTDFISIQAHILSFGIAKLNGYGIGISNHLSKISTKPNDQSSRLMDDCFTMYLRSKPFRDQVIKSGIVRTEIPTAFINYTEDLIAKHEMYERNSKRY